MVESILKIIRSVPTLRLIYFCLTRITASSCWKGLPRDEEEFAIFFHFMLSSSIWRITKLTRKVNFPTSTSIFSAIPTGYWNDLSAIGSSSSSSLSKLIGVSELSCFGGALLGLVECYLEEIQKVDQIACQESVELSFKVLDGGLMIFGYGFELGFEIHECFFDKSVG
ncbi:hypothetical protein Tco_0970759 [Tanacetum coccineum]